jgi:chorismate mutase
MNIQQLRNKIHTIDTKIASLIAARQSLMPLVGLYKKNNNIPINQPKREREILVEMEILANKEKLNPDMLKKIFKLLFKDAKERQRKV